MALSGAYLAHQPYNAGAAEMAGISSLSRWQNLFCRRTASDRDNDGVLLQYELCGGAEAQGMYVTLAYAKIIVNHEACAGNMAAE